MSRPASTPRAVAALTGLELRLTARRAENVLVTLVIPVAALLFFAGTAGTAAGFPARGERVAFLLPGTIALAIIASGLVNLGIATAYERSYGVLKRLGGAPITRATLVTAKLLAIALLVVVQVVLLVVVARVGLDWSPGASWSPLLLVGAIALGTTAFAGLGLLLAGSLRAEATLALANALFLGLLMLGGIVVPIADLPGWLQLVASLLPATALADLLRAALDSGEVIDVQRSAAILAAWAIGTVGLSARTFRWE